MSLVKKILDKFGRNLETAAKKNLSRKDKNASKRLSNSLKFKTVEKDGVFIMTGTAEDYWEFVDRGVKGKGGTKADGSKWKLKRVTDNKFKYKNKRPPTKVFNLWSVRRGLAPRTSGGQFTTRKSLLFAIAESVYRTGLETTHFLTAPAEKLLKSIPNKLIEAYGLEVEELLQKQLNGN